MKPYTNAHCHLDKVRDLNNFLSNSPDIFVCNALNEDELQRYLSVKKDNFLLTTGQHPLYPPNTITNKRLIELLDDNNLFAVGEIGLDKRNPDFEHQKEVFMNQADIAHQYHKPIIIHCVGYYYELLSIIKLHFPKLPFTLHAFIGSMEIIKEFSKYNVTFSLHKNITKIKNAEQVITEILQNHKYSFETDVCKDNLNDVRETIKYLANYYEKVTTTTYKSVL